MPSLVRISINFGHGHQQLFVRQVVHFSPLTFIGHFQQRHLAVHDLYCFDGILSRNSGMMVDLAI